MPPWRWTGCALVRSRGAGRGSGVPGHRTVRAAGAGDAGRVDVVNVTELRILASPAGAALLEEATRCQGTENEFSLGRRLRRERRPELVATALTLARLRHRAQAKFDPADAHRMFFTVEGYEQATRASVARHRATRIARLGAGVQVLDLCSGVGGDLIELARAGLRVTGVEADPLVAEAARLNVDVLGLSAQANVVTGDATTPPRASFAAVSCDPARRTSRGRVFDPSAYQPPWPFVLELLQQTACVKVAPGLPHDRIPDDVEAEWVSDAGEVKEAALWSGALARPGVRRRATLLRREAPAATLTDADDPGGSDVRGPGRYVYEPDGAVIRAGLVTAVASIAVGWLLDASIAYVSSDTQVSTPFARGYEIVDVLPYDVKALRRYVRDRGVGTLAIKKRGVDVTPEDLRRTLRPAGDRTATLIVTRVDGRATVLVAKPLPH